MKLLLENWREYIKEARGDQETSAITRLVILRLKKIIDTAINAGAATLLEYSIQNSVPGFLSSLPRFDTGEFVSILHIERLKKQQQQAQKSQILSHINKIILRLVFTEPGSQNVKATVTGGSWEPGENTLTIGPIKLGGMLEKNKKSLYGWIEDFNLTLNNVIKHELEHAYQDEKDDDNLKTLLKSYSYEMGNLDTEEGIKFAMSQWSKRLYNGALSIFRSKPKTSVEDYREILNKYAEELKLFRQATPDDFGDDELILYYFQDLEIEAYAAGFYREARLKAAKWLKSNPDSRAPGVGRDLIKVFFEDIVDNYAAIQKAIWGAQGAPGDHKDAIYKVTSEWETKVMEYAKKRFPLLSDRKDLGR